MYACLYLNTGRLKVKAKRKIGPVLSTNAYRERRGIAPLIHKPSIGCEWYLYLEAVKLQLMNSNVCKFSSLRFM